MVEKKLLTLLSILSLAVASIPASAQISQQCRDDPGRRFNPICNSIKQEAEEKETDQAITLEPFIDSELLSTFDSQRIRSGDVYTALVADNVSIPSEVDCRDSSPIARFFSGLVNFRSVKEISIFVVVSDGPIDFESPKSKGLVTEIAKIRKVSSSICSAETTIRERGLLSRVRSDEKRLGIYVGMVASTEIGYDFSDALEQTTQVVGGNMVGVVSAAAPILGAITKNSSSTFSRFGKINELKAYPPADDQHGFAVRLNLGNDKFGKILIKQEIDEYHLLGSVDSLLPALKRATLQYTDIRNGVEIMVNESLEERLLKSKLLPDYGIIGDNLEKMASACRAVKAELVSREFPNRPVNLILAYMMLEFPQLDKFATEQGANVCLIGDNRDLFDEALERRNFRGCRMFTKVGGYVLNRVKEIRSGEIPLSEFSLAELAPSDLAGTPEEALKDALGNSAPFPNTPSCFRNLGGPNAGSIKGTPNCTYTFKVKRLGGSREDNWVVFGTEHSEDGTAQVRNVRLFSDPYQYSSIPDSKSRCAWPAEAQN